MLTKQNQKPTIDFIYNPDNQTKEQLIESFVVRQKTFQRLFADIKEAKMNSPEQHYLIEGKRGMGKTTLLLRLGYEIENDENLSPWLIPVVFNEEEYSIRKLYKLWERIAMLLEEKNQKFIGLYDEMDSSFPNYSSDEEYEYAIFNLLNVRLEEAGKKLILFIDNFGDIFLKFNGQEIQRLRTVLQTSINFRIFGASSTVLEAFYDSKHPFYDFFKITRLSGLDKLETIELLSKLADTYNLDNVKYIIENQSGKIEALRRVTGGVIRTIVLLFEIFIDQKQGSTFSDLEAILDRVTPLYKHRMDDLPPQQQEIVEALAFAWDAINVSEISQKTRIVSKSVSAQLYQMEKNEIIIKKLTNNKNHFYQISERFFNIWYLMRHGRKGDKRKVLWLVRFLEEWCDANELIERTKHHIGLLKTGTYDTSGAYYLTEALASTKTLPYKSQDELIKVTRDFLNNKNSEFAHQLSDSMIEMIDKAEHFLFKNEFRLALNLYLKIKKGAEYLIGFCYYKLNNFPKAEEYYLKAFDAGNYSSLINLAELYYEVNKDFEKADEYFSKAVEKEDPSSFFSIGYFYEDKIKDYGNAEKYYLLATKNGVDAAHLSLGMLYEDKLKNYSKAEEYFLMSIEKRIEEASLLLAYLYDSKLEDFEKAEKYYLKTKGSYSKLAMLGLGIMSRTKLKDYEKAEKYLKKAIKKGNDEAYFFLAALYDRDLGDYLKAEEYYLLAIENGNIEANDYLAELYHFELNDYAKAEKYYLEGIKNGSEDSMLGLGLFYEYELKDLKKAEKYYLMASEKGSPTAMNNLSYYYYCDGINKNKALELSQKSYLVDNNEASRLTYAKTLLWNNNFDKAKLIAEEFLFDEKYTNEYLEYFNDFLYLLIAKSQYKFLYNYFVCDTSKENNIKDKLKPIWYALVFYMQDEYPNEFLRMGDELEETVTEIIEEIEIMRNKYE